MFRQNSKVKICADIVRIRNQKMLNRRNDMGIKSEIEEKYQHFLEDIKDSEFIFSAYMDETEYEDEYSHNSIGWAMEVLKNKITEYLHENRPGEFIVYSDWSIHVTKKDKAEEMGLRKSLIESSIVR